MIEAMMRLAAWCAAHSGWAWSIYIDQDAAFGLLCVRVRLDRGSDGRTVQNNVSISGAELQHQQAADVTAMRMRFAADRVIRAAESCSADKEIA